MKTNDKYKGAYICSCGQWYDIDYCGLPTVESNCFNCNQKIGGTNYGRFCNFLGSVYWHSCFSNVYFKSILNKYFQYK